MVSFFGCGRISLIGHYSKDGLRMRSRLGDHATEMFWLLEDTVAFGGRAALLPLLYHTCRAIFRKIPPSKHGSIQSADCTACKGPKAVFFRSASMDNTAIRYGSNSLDCIFCQDCKYARGSEKYSLWSLACSTVCTLNASMF